MEKDQNIKKSWTKVGLIHKIFLIHLKNNRLYTACTKTKSEIRGGGKKPWRQKGTGQARAGSTRSPLWRGGGVTFGPQPRIVKKKSNRKERRLAILSAFFLKQKACTFIDHNFLKDFSSGKTKELMKYFEKKNVTLTSKTLLLLESSNIKIFHASKNLKNLEVSTLSTVSLVSLVNANQILLAPESLKLINFNT